MGKTKAIELNKLKTRMAMIESKQKPADLPDLKDISSLLEYFNLKKDCNKDDVNDTINLRLMEISPESTVSQDIFNNMSEERKEALAISYNQANDILLKHVKNRKKLQSIEEKNKN